MEAAPRVHARIIPFLVLLILVTLVAVAPAIGLRRSARHARGSTMYSTSWSAMSFRPFAKPTTAPGLAAPSVDGTLIACQSGKAGSTPDATGLDILYRFRGGSSGTWGGPGDQLQPSVCDGLIAGLDMGFDDVAVAVFDPAKGTAVQMSGAASLPFDPAMGEDVVVWEQHQDSDGDIYGRAFDRAAGLPTGDVFPICTVQGRQLYPAVSGHLVVWQDRRNGDWDIYGYDLGEKREFAICTAQGDQKYPDIQGQTVVWQDSRRGQWDIYSCDLATMHESPICRARGAQTRPAVSDQLVVWQDKRPRFSQTENEPTKRYDTPHVFAYLLPAHEELDEVWMEHEAYPQTRPDVSDGLVVWEETYREKAPGAVYIAGAAISDMWAYGSTGGPRGLYVSSPDLTYTFDVAVCPAPPVTQVGFADADESSMVEDFIWQPFASPVTFTLQGGDGRRVAWTSLKDSAGNVPGASGEEVILDTHGPSCWTPTPLTARAGDTVLLQYKVTDKLSPKAKASIAIVNAHGATVRTLAARWVGTGVWKQRTIVCDLLKGTYTIEVTATDLAGNPQQRVGTTTLVVR